MLGTDLGSFIEKKIFEPLGITRFEYDRCPEGYFYGASGAKLTVNELSRIGLLLYNRGMFEGQRILSEKYTWYTLRRFLYWKLLFLEKTKNSKMIMTGI